MWLIVVTGDLSVLQTEVGYYYYFPCGLPGVRQVVCGGMSHGMALLAQRGSIEVWRDACHWEQAWGDHFVAPRCTSAPCGGLSGRPAMSPVPSSKPLKTFYHKYRLHGGLHYHLFTKAFWVAGWEPVPGSRASTPPLCWSRTMNRLCQWPGARLEWSYLQSVLIRSVITYSSWTSLTKQWLYKEECCWRAALTLKPRFLGTFTQLDTWDSILYRLKCNAWMCLKLGHCW